MTRAEAINIMDTMRISGEMSYNNFKLVTFKVGTKEATYLITTTGADLPLWLKWGNYTYVVNLSTFKAPLKRSLYFMYNRPDRLYKLQYIGKDVVRYHYGISDYERYINSDFRI